MSLSKICKKDIACIFCKDYKLRCNGVHEILAVKIPKGKRSPKFKQIYVLL